MIRRPPRFPLFPDTTLSRPDPRLAAAQVLLRTQHRVVRERLHGAVAGPLDPGRDRLRSEEHTSELQSRQYLVCRLLLEKKKKHAHLLQVLDGRLIGSLGVAR